MAESQFTEGEDDFLEVEVEAHAGDLANISLRTSVRVPNWVKDRSKRQAARQRLNETSLFLLRSIPIVDLQDANEQLEVDDDDDDKGEFLVGPDGNIKQASAEDKANIKKEKLKGLKSEPPPEPEP